jgi:internalin A
MAGKSGSVLVSPEGLQLLMAAKARLGLSFAAIAERAGVSADTVQRLFHPEWGQGVGSERTAKITAVLDLALEQVTTPLNAEAEVAFAEAQQRIQKALDKNADTLDLSGLGLTSVPPELGKLANLSVLDLDHNQLTNIPAELGQLTNLSVLYLHQNQLTSVPPELEQLTNLSVLHLHQNQLASIPAELGQLVSLSVLYLDHNQLISIPAELGQLEGLWELYLHQNQLTSVPAELGQLANLSELYLDHNQLTSIPAELGQLATLSELYLYHNQLTNIPAELGQLADLSVFYLDHNQLTSIPAELGQLVNLSVLSLSHNQLTSVPAELGHLANLSRLSLSHNQLTSVPAALGQLANLSGLSLSHNQLTSVPAELGQLANLSELYFSRNQLTSIPTELGQLANLSRLYLDHNQLTSVPATLGQLANLSGLYLYQNQLTSIPAELGQLANLSELSLYQNQLTSIPAELGQLTNLSMLYLHGNDKLGLSDEVLGPTWQQVNSGATPANPQDILSYYFKLLVNRTPLNEAKLILVGFGKVGKTSLASRLIHNTFDVYSKKTEGIKITKWPLQLNEAENITLHVWDFGGQEIMHSTHQFFLTERSLYLLVLNGRQGHEDEDADYWLELIQSFGGNSPVIVVLNKIHEHPFDVNRGALQQKFSNIRAFIATDCETEMGLAELQATIEQETDALEHLRTPFPKSWVAIKDRLAQMADNYISFEQYRQFCQHDGEDDRSAQDSLAVHLHSLGIALNYKDDPRLRDTHVLNPHWVTNGIYTLLNAPELADRKGELAATCLDRLLDASHYPPERHGFLLDLMRKFELCFRFEEDDGRFLIPDLLDKQQPEAAKSFDPHQCLNFRYQYPILPEGLLPRFIVRTHVLSNDQLRWRTGVILTFEGNRALVKADRSDRTVTISVDGPVASRRRLLAVIRSDFERIHRSFKFTPQELVPVPDHPDIVLPYADLLVMEQDGLTELPQVIDRKVVKLNVRDLLQGVDLGGTRPRRGDELRRSRALRLFYSYAHPDEHLRDELEIHLKLLERQGLIQPWHDRRIQPGVDWRQELDRNLEQADIILLLVSPSFRAIASSFQRILVASVVAEWTLPVA